MKSHTDLPQSKKLAEILPIESADMWWAERYAGKVMANGQYIVDEKPVYYLSLTKPSNDNYSQDTVKDIPCWSLAALLDLLDDVVINDEGNEYSLTISKEEGMYYIHYHDRWEEVSDIETDCYYDLIDACYEMILELHRQKLL